MAEQRQERSRLPLAVYFGFGLRNLGRNPQRTLLSLASLVIGMGVVTFLGALVDGWLHGMHDNFILTATGHLQVRAPGHFDSGSLKDALANPDAVSALLQQDPRVEAWSPRLEASGLASVAQGATGVTLLGIRPESEHGTSRLLDLVSPGACLRNYRDRQLVLGSEVATTLAVEPGDQLVLMGQAPEGELVSELFQLCGILHSGAPELDRRVAMIPLQTAQRWLQMGDRVTHIVVRLKREQWLPALAASLRSGLPSDRFQVLEWHTLDPMVEQWLRFGELYGLIILGIVVALTITQVSNTLLLALHERQREFAIMEALGTRRCQLFLMVAWESMLLVVVGGALGYAAGVLTVLAVQGSGIDFSRFSGAFHFFFMDPVVHPELTLRMGLKILAALLLAAVLGGLYPAWKAARLDPMEALR